MPLQPFTGTFGPAELRHLLRRTLFGYTKADLDYFQGKSLSFVVDHLLTSLPLPSPPVRFVDCYRDDRPPINSIGIECPQEIMADPNNTKIEGGKHRDFFQQYVGYVGPNGGAGNLNTQWVNRVPQPNFDGFQKASVISWWCGQMLNHRPQAANIITKMSLFLHNMLPVQNKGLGALYSYQYLDLLQKYALGSYKELVEKMTLEPLMLDYLNGNGSSASTGATPNENYARELLELFTTGKKSGTTSDTYTEDDIKKIARFLTGWKINTAYDNRLDNRRVLFDATKHAKPACTLSNYFVSTTYSFPIFIAINSNDPVIVENAAKFRIKRLLDLIFAKDDVAQHITRKLYRFFVYGFTDKHECFYNDTIENSIILPLAQTLKKKNYELRSVLKELLMSEHFFAQTGSLIKSPFDLIVGTLRMFDLDKQVPPINIIPSNGDPAIYQVSMRDNLKCLARYRMWEVIVSGNAMDMGFQLFNPPNVAGLPAYHQQGVYHREWVASSVFLNKRMLFLKNVIDGYPRLSVPKLDVNVSLQWQPPTTTNQSGHFYYPGGSPLVNGLPNSSPPNTTAYFNYFLNLYDPSGTLSVQDYPIFVLVKGIVGTNASISYDNFVNALFDYFLAVRPLAGGAMYTAADTSLEKGHWQTQTPSPWSNYLTSATGNSTYSSLTNANYMLNLLKTFFGNCILNSPEFQLM